MVAAISPVGFFAGAKAAKPNAPSGNYIRPGDYLLEILECKTIKSEGGKQGFVTNFKVIEATEGSSHKPGDEPSQWMDRASRYFLGDVKAFASAVMNVEFDAVDDKGLEKIAAQSQPLRGKRVRAHAFDKETKATKGMNVPDEMRKYFTNVVYKSASK